MHVQSSKSAVAFRRFAVVLFISVLAAASPAGFAGTWTRLAHDPPAAINLMLLLPDGTVIACNQNGSTIGKAWYKLTPDSQGSYINGTWTTLASMHDTRLYFQSQVLKDGRVYVSGGEYGTGGPKAEIYDPLTNVWTQLTIPSSLWNPSTDDFYDCNSEILPDGSVLLMPVFPHTPGRAIKYNPATNTWSSGGTLFRGTWQDEATWSKLPDDTIITLDPFGSNTYGNSPSERYNPATNTWINDAVSPVNLYDAFGFEIGGSLLLPNGKVFFLGSNGNTAIYTPSGTTSPGAWVAGPVIPGNHGVPDGPCAMMVNGKILCAVSPVPTSGNHFPTPTTFYEYDYVANSFTSVGAPVGSSDNIACYQAMMLCLPDGKVLYSHMGTSVYAYTPTGAPLAAGKPTVLSVSPNGDGSYHLTGLGLNGISEGASYGDDWQMNTNYPLVRLSSVGGNVYYARTYNWSSTSVMTGSQVLSTEYRLPAGLPAGQYTFVVVANGIASDPFCTNPAIGSNPSSQTACTGDAAAFTVTATGSGPLTYQWRRGTTNLSNGGNISGSNTATLVIDPVGTSDAGSNYNCLVSNGCGSQASNNATLTVQAAPSITLNPVSQAVCQNGGVTFTVAASGAAPLSYQWRKNTINIGGATSSSYTDNNVQPADAGSYDCVVSNACDSATSAAATLTVNTPPAITQSPADQSACDGDAVAFSVTASGAGPLTYQWRKNGVALVDGGHISGATTDTLTIDPVSASDADNYDCVVGNACGNVPSNSAALTVDEAPAITDSPDSQIVAAGNAVTFTVVATGAGPLTYQWRKDGIPLTDGPTGNGSVLNGAATDTLTLTNAAKLDAGTYDVVVTNICGAATSGAATLKVRPVLLPPAP